MPIVNVDENLTDEIIEEDKLLAEQVKIADGDIVFNVAGEYKVPMHSCRTHAEVLDWVEHLADKTWMNNKVMLRFIMFARGVIDGKVK
ncbi:hypothetical protein JOE25_002449 [Serratia sp. PL17]|uniref:hypothetical protein n=1 Tax=Serratia sp. PL17 TaxID=2806582 RepID=UPI001AE7E4A5|nr:hypothetical protein [Serratia sp. PL17]MBP1130875.1 hypothetical protein [Serratia sp. PL17]